MATVSREVATDERGGSLSAISVLHLRGHQGRSYNWDRLFTGIVNNGNVDIYIVVDATESLHIQYRATVGGNCEGRFYENPTVSAPGTLHAPVNRNRNTPDGLLSTFYYTPTVTGVGTILLEEALIPGGAGGNSIGGVAGSLSELILKGGNTYLVRITNVSGGATEIAPLFTFYKPVGSYNGNDWDFTA